MGKIVQPLLVVAAIAVNVIPGVGQVLSAAMISAITTAGITAGIGLAASALGLGPKSPSVSPSTRNRLYASIDPATPRKLIFGETAMATDIRYQEYGGANQEYFDEIICLASHEITSCGEIWFDDKLAWSNGAVQGDYAGYLSVDVRLEGNAGNTIPINGGAKWGANRRMTGLAYLRLRFKLTGNSKKSESPFAQSIPQRLTIIGQGCPVYDPRFDSTRGGSGPARADDQTTWQFSYGGVVSGRNPACQMLTYLLGWRINGKLAVGRGIPAARFDMESFITAANACDEPVALVAGGTEPRYRGDGIFSEADDPRAVIDTIEATANAKLRDAGGRFSLTAISNDLATPRFDFDDSDVLNEFRWTPTADIDRAFNEVRGRFTCADRVALFQLVDFPRYRQAPADGIERVQTLDLPMVQSASQAQRLARQQFARNLYQGRFEAQMGVRGWAVQLGDVVTLTFSALGWDKRLFRVVEHGIRPDGICPMVLQEEHADIYLWDRDERPMVEPVKPVPYDAAKSVLLQLLEAGQLTYADGTTLQAFATDMLARIAAAQADATNSLAQLAVIASDGYLSKGEKPDVIARYNDIVNEQAALVAQANALAASPAALQAAQTALANYLGSLSPAWNNTNVDTPVVAADFRNAFSTYYQARTSLLTAMTAKVQANVGEVKTAADQAKADAATANAQLAIIASDGYLSKGEKPDVIARYNDTVNEQGPLVSQAQAVGVDAAGLQSAQAALANYLGSLSPAWNNTATDTPINANDFRNAFANYYLARVNLITAITAKVQANAAAAATKADQAQATAATANASIAIIVSDAYLSRDEKPGLKDEVRRIQEEYGDNIASAAAYPNAVNSGSYTAVYNDLLAYLGGLSPAWNALGTDTPIDRDTFSTKFASYYQVRQFLLNDIAYAASVWGNITGDLKPDDGATAGMNLIRSPDKLLRTFYTGGAYKEGGAAGLPNNGAIHDKHRVVFPAGGALVAAYWEPIAGALPVIPNDVLFAQFDALFATGTFRFVVRFFDIALNDLGAVFGDIASNGTNNWRTVGGVQFTVPGNAASVQVYSQWYGGAGVAYAACPVLQKVAPGADNTAALIAAGAADTRIQSYTTPLGNKTQYLTEQGRIMDSRALNPANVTGLRSLGDLPTFFGNDYGAIDPSNPNGPIAISITAFNYYTDRGVTIAFPAGFLPGKQYGTVYYIWRNVSGPEDAGYSYDSSTNLRDALGTNKVYIGYFKTPDAPGGQPDYGGSGGGGYETCVALDEWVDLERGPTRARDVVPGDRIRVLRVHRAGYEWETVEFNEPGENWVVRLRTESGVELALAINTPVPIFEGGYQMAANTLGRRVPVLLEGGSIRWERVESVEAEDGEPLPVARITCGQRVFAAGSVPGRYILSHNIQYNYYKP